MNPKQLLAPAIGGLIAMNIASGCTESRPEELPNILWITSEDNSPFAGCYGDNFAHTPNMDKLASEGFLYTHAFANAPVCAPSRNTILTGVYANSGGHQHMRSQYPKSDLIKPYPVYLREAGYYCTNNSKQDYNVPGEQTTDIWDESSLKAHYKNRPEGKPFFAIFNSTISHESSLHKRTPIEELRHNPDSVMLPPYHPDTPDMRHDWAQYYDKISDLDAWIGKILQELDDSGEAENTIVFYYGDHGGVLARSKRFLYDSGTHVPFIVKIPEKYKYLFPEKEKGSKVGRLVGFVDLVPTLLSIAGIPVPTYLQGNAFLGDQKSPDPEYVYMFRDRMDERYDMSRSVRDKKFRYIRNYLPYRPYGQHLEYLWLAPHVKSWEEAFLRGECNETQSKFWLPKPVEELYDSENDPWETVNLAGDPAYADILLRMREECTDWSLRIKDAGFIPETEYTSLTGGKPMYDYLREKSIPHDSIVEAAHHALMAEADDISKLTSYLRSPVGAIRYWGATGLLRLGSEAKDATPDLLSILDNPSPAVVCVASEALYNLGEKEAALKALQKVIENPGEMSRCYAMNVVASLGVDDPGIREAVIQTVTSQPDGGREQYDLRMAKSLVMKWQVDLEKHQIEFAW